MLLFLQHGHHLQSMQAAIPPPPRRVVWPGVAAGPGVVLCVGECPLFGDTQLLEMLYAAWSAAADAAGIAMLLLLLLMLMLLPCCYWCCCCCCCCEHMHPPQTVTTPR